MVWTCGVVRVRGTLTNTILQSKVEGKRPRGRPVIQWLDDVTEWTGLSWTRMSMEPEHRWAGKKLANRV